MVLGIKFIANLTAKSLSQSGSNESNFSICYPSRVVWCQACGKTMDHVDLLREQLKILSGEVAFQTSVLKRLTEETGRSPKNEKIQVLSYLR
jgi:hypothetical protein